MGGRGLQPMEDNETSPCLGYRLRKNIASLAEHSQIYSRFNFGVQIE